MPHRFVMMEDLFSAWRFDEIVVFKDLKEARHPLICHLSYYNLISTYTSCIANPRMLTRVLTTAMGQLINFHQCFVPLLEYAVSIEWVTLLDKSIPLVTITITIYTYEWSHNSHNGMKGKNSSVIDKHSFLLFIIGLRRRIQNASKTFLAPISSSWANIVHRTLKSFPACISLLCLPSGLTKLCLRLAARCSLMRTLKTLPVSPI